MNKSLNKYWYIQQPEDVKLDKTAGKFVAYVRANNFTTEEERFLFFDNLITVINANNSFPVCGKIGRNINIHNLCPILLYCNDDQREELKTSIKKIKTLLNDQHWLLLSDSLNLFANTNQHASGKHKILTWHWYWKSNQKTLEEIKNKTHWTFKQKIRT
jgi:hypothetical protein